MTEAETQKVILTRVEGTVTDLADEMKQLSKGFTELATEYRLDRETRTKTEAAADTVHVELHNRVKSLEDWRTTVQATEKAAPRLTWSRLLTDVRVWLLALGGIALAVIGVYAAIN